jgi:hypothetical protein
LNFSLFQVTLKRLQDELAPKRRGAVDFGTKQSALHMSPEMTDVDVTRWFDSQFSVANDLTSHMSDFSEADKESGDRIRQLSSKNSSLLMSVNNWNFDIILLSEKGGGSPLVLLAVTLLHQYNLHTNLSLDPKIFEKFVDAVEKTYQDVPYHNNLHAVDVLQASNFFLGTGDVLTIGKYSSLEVLGGNDVQ